MGKQWKIGLQSDFFAFLIVPPLDRLYLDWPFRSVVVSLASSAEAEE